MKHWSIQPSIFPLCQINQETAISWEPLRCPKVPVMTLVKNISKWQKNHEKIPNMQSKISTWLNQPVWIMMTSNCASAESELSLHNPYDGFLASHWVPNEELDFIDLIPILIWIFHVCTCITVWWICYALVHIKITWVSLKDRESSSKGSAFQ